VSLPVQRTMTDDPVSIIAQEKMSTLQMVVIVLCVLTNALDGFDVQSISFASPYISSEWGISRAALGVVLSMELFGMALGSIAIGNFADRIGRRPAILSCLSLMAIGMYLASTANGVLTLSIFRLITGMGIGGMIAADTAMVAEVANDRRRNMCITLVVAGYPAGAALGGTLTSLFLIHATWRAIFIFGASATFLIIPLCFAFMPESVPFLARSHSSGTLEKVNAILSRMGHSKALRLTPTEMKATVPLAALFRPKLIVQTILLSAAYFTHVISFYFVLKWLPKILTDRGFSSHGAVNALVWANLGGILGALLLSVVIQWFEVRKLVVASLLAGSLAIMLLGNTHADLTTTSVLAGVSGFCIYAAISGLYALFARTFPTGVRAAGTGFVIGVGRGGAVVGPILAGVLFSAGVGIGGVSILMALGSLTAAVLLQFISRTSPDYDSVQDS
jgi:benzoate transport